jgi:hypothetical protein
LKTRIRLEQFKKYLVWNECRASAGTLRFATAFRRWSDRTTTYQPALAGLFFESVGKKSPAEAGW